MGGPPTTSSLTSPASSRASNLLHRNTWGTELGWELPVTPNWDLFPLLPLNCLPLLDDSRARSPPLFGRCHPCVFLTRSAQLLHQSISYLHSLILLNLSPSSFSSSTTPSRSPTCSHLTQVEAPPPFTGIHELRQSSCTLHKTHCSQRPEPHTKGGNSLRVATLFLARAFRHVDTVARFAV